MSEITNETPNQTNLFPNMRGEGGTIPSINQEQTGTPLPQNRYNFQYLTFPGDLGTDYSDHYMVININVPVSTTGGLVSSFSNLPASLTGTILENTFSKVDSLRFGQQAGFAATPTSGPLIGSSSINVSDVGSLNQSATIRQRSTRRIAQSIALYMPNTVVYNTQNAYEDISLTALLGSMITGAAGGVLKASAAAGRSAGGAVGTALGFLGAFGDAGRAGQVARLAGYPINPRIEVVYANTLQRQFVFEFLLAPRNESESVAVRSIIKTLRFHADPEVAYGGFVLIPPSEFDITFFHKGKENLNIPRINTCVLERIETDYAPTGIYSTFSTGQPVAVRLSLGFREVEISHKLRVAQDF